MLSLYRAICSRVVSWCKGDLYVEGFHQFFKQPGHKTIPIVRDCPVTEAKPGHPLKEGLSDLGGRVLTKGISLKPPAGPVKAGEEEPVALL